MHDDGRRLLGTIAVSCSRPRLHTAALLVGLLTLAVPVAAEDQAVTCQRAIEAWGLRYASVVQRAIGFCAHHGGDTSDSYWETCFASPIVQASLDAARASAHLSEACAGVNLESDLGYTETCAPPPGVDSGFGPRPCTFVSSTLDAPGPDNDLLDCLACQITMPLRRIGGSLFAFRPVSNRCQAALGARGTAVLKVLIQKLGRCLRQPGATSTAACFATVRDGARINDRVARWRATAETKCSTIDPYADPGYTCGRIVPADPTSCDYSATPCVIPLTSSLSATGPDNDLLDCLTCNVEEAALGVARDLYGANLCCTDDGCRTVLSRVSCREVGGAPAFYRVDTALQSSSDTHALAVGGDGTLYSTVPVPGTLDTQIIAVSPGGAETIRGTVNPATWGLAADPAGNVYVSQRCGSQVRRLAPDGTDTVVAGTGTPGHSGDGGPATEAELVGPNRVAVDGQGNLLITESGLVSSTCDPPGKLGAGERIRLVDPAGTIHTVAGAGPYGITGEDGPALTARIAYPYAVSPLHGGGFLIAEAGALRVLRIDSSGTLTRVAGMPAFLLSAYSGDGGPARRARMDPHAAVEDSQGNIIIADKHANKIRLVDRLGTIISIAGTGAAPSYDDPGPVGDGGPGLVAWTVCPIDVAVGPDDRVYVAELRNTGRIRVLSLQRY